MSKADLRTLLISKGLNLSRLAEAVGVDKATVTRWAQRRIPAERVNEVSRVTGLPKENLRPDIFDPSEDRANS